MLPDGVGGGSCSRPDLPLYGDGWAKVAWAERFAACAAYDITLQPVQVSMGPHVA